jgi:hypothetical protein
MHDCGISGTFPGTNLCGRVIKSRRWAEQVERMKKKRGAYRVLVGNQREREHLKDPAVDGMII